MRIPMQKYREQMLDILEKLIAIPSVKQPPQLNMPYGKPVFEALMFMLDAAEHMDLESVNLFGHMGYASYGEGKETLALLTHLDVVPPGEGWDTDPFTAVRKDGRIYGRGAVDDKGAAVASLFALHAVKENCITLNKQVRVMFGCDEESGWQDIDFFKANYPEPDALISPDAGFPIINREKGLQHLQLELPAKPAEDGIAICSLQAGTRPNIVPNRAECVLRCKGEALASLVALFNEESPAKIAVEERSAGEVALVCTGKAAHGCHPDQGVNALAYLIAFLNTLPLADGGYEKMVYALAQTVGLDYTGALLGVACEDALSGALTVNLGVMETREDSVVARLDVRSPISVDIDELFDRIKARFAPLGVTVSRTHCLRAHHVPEDAPLVAALKKVYEQCFGEPPVCHCSAGATYARAFKNGVAFGPAPLEKDCREHGPNEFMDIDDIVNLAQALADAIIELAAVQ